MRKKNFKIQEKTDVETLNYVVDRFNAAKDSRKKHEDNWKRWYELYRSRSSTGDRTKSNLFIPETFTIVETVHPRLAAPYLSTSEPPFDIIPREPDYEQNADVMTAVLTYYLERAKFPLFLSNFFKQAEIYGTSIAKTFFDPSLDSPKSEMVDLFDFFIDPSAASIDLARYCIHRKMLSPDEMQQRVEAGIYSEIDMMHGGTGTDDDTLNPATSEELDEYSTPEEMKRDIEILEYWEDDRLIVVANRQDVVRDEPNPFSHGKKPFTAVVLIPVPGEFYGIGLIEPIESLQLELNTKCNQRIDNVNLILNQMWLLQQGSIDDLKQLTSKPGGVIIVNDINGIKPLPVSDVTSISSEEEERIRHNIQNTSGVAEYIKGTSEAGGKQTATEVNAKTTQAQNRLDFNFKLMAEMGLSEIGDMFIALIQQFVTTEVVIRIAGAQGAQFQPVQPEQIQGKFDIQVNPDPLGIDENARMQKTMQALDIVSKLPGANPLPIIEKALKKLDINEDEIQAALAPVRMAQQTQAQQMQAQAQMASMPQSGQMPQGGIPQLPPNPEPSGMPQGVPEGLPGQGGGGIDPEVMQAFLAEQGGQNG